MPEHTTGALRVEIFEGDIAALVSDTDGLIADCGHPDDSMPNARELARRWNCHEKLVEAVREALGAIKVFHGEPGWDIYESNAPEMKRIAAALAEAEGK